MQNALITNFFVFRTKKELSSALMEFFYTCHMLRERLSIPTEKIGNVDEVPVYYDMTDLYTLDSQQNSNPVVLTGGGEKKQVTVILSCCADGRKLTPVIIYGGTTKKSIEGFQVYERLYQHLSF
jgi:hypothetical protein